MASWPETIERWLSGLNSVNILVTGKGFTGKSSLINGIVGQSVAKEHDKLNRELVEAAVQAFPFKYHDVDITIWDSPGLQDGSDKDEEYIRDMISKGCADADLVFYCTRMNDTRFRQEDYVAIKKITRGLGKGIWNNAIFVMTFANECCIIHKHGQNLTPKEKRNRKSDVFKKQLKNWNERLAAAVVEAGVDVKIAAGIPIVPVGYEVKQALPNCDNWLNSLWYASTSQVKEQLQSALKKAYFNQILSGVFAWNLLIILLHVYHIV